MEGYFVKTPYGEMEDVIMREIMTVEEARGIIGSPMVGQLRSLASRSKKDPVVAAQLLHNTIGKEDAKFQAAAHVVWNHLIG